MSGIISEAELLAVTLIFAAALVATGINLFLLLNKSTQLYLDRYVDAVVTQTNTSVEALAARGVISYVEIAKSLRSDAINVNRVDIYHIGGSATYNLNVSEAYNYMFRYSNKFARVTYSQSGTDYILIITEVER